MAGKLTDLAVNSAPSFKCLVPSLNKMVKFRSFLVKEQKLLLIAKEAKENQIDAITSAITQLIGNCILDDGIVVEDLPSFDLEYIFVQLFMHSSAKKTSNAWYKCKAKTGENGEECGEKTKVVIDLTKAHIKASQIKTGMIDVGSESVDKIKVRYPTFEQMVRFDLAMTEERQEDAFRIYGECLVNVFKKDETLLVLGEDYDVDDAIEFLEYMPGAVFDKVVEMFTEAPAVTSEADFCCSKCGNKAKIELKGLEDFF